MEKLVQGDQDKTEQLEHLRKENSQLLLTLAQQVESQMEPTFLGIREKIRTWFFVYSVTYADHWWLWERSQRKPSEMRELMALLRNLGKDLLLSLPAARSLAHVRVPVLAQQWS